MTLAWLKMVSHSIFLDRPNRIDNSLDSENNIDGLNYSVFETSMKPRPVSGVKAPSFENVTVELPYQDHARHFNWDLLLITLAV